MRDKNKNFELLFTQVSSGARADCSLAHTRSSLSGLAVDGCDPRRVVHASRVQVAVDVLHDRHDLVEGAAAWFVDTSQHEGGDHNNQHEKKKK